MLRAGHPAIANGSLTLERFCAFDHAIVSYIGGAFRGATDVALEALGLSRRVVLSVPGFTKIVAWHECTHQAWLRTLLFVVCRD